MYASMPRELTSDAFDMRKSPPMFADGQYSFAEAFLCKRDCAVR